MLYVNPYASNTTLMTQGATSREREGAALQEFERQFLREFMKSMRAMVPEGTLFPSSQQSELFTEMLDDHLAGAMAESGQLGVARQMQTQLDARRESGAPRLDTSA